MNKEQIRFIDRLYKDLYLEESVIHHGSGNKYDKFDNINLYMQKLEDIHNKVADTGRHKELLRNMYYDKYIIKPEDIPESYYEHQQEIALERGYGHVEITEEVKKQYEEQIINDQKSSLDVWLSYFISEDSNIYPFWAKYWAFQGMLKLGNYDKEKGEFGRRTKDTVAPFVDLNREALAISIDMVIKMLNKENIDDKGLEILVKSGSFGKIYSYVINKVLKDNTSITKRNIGKWVKYNRGSDHMLLVNSLKGYNTGWCTVGESTAKTQLSSGDFYVYYTVDEKDEYKVPRIAIRMEYNKIAEIRGIAEDQNLEPEMEEVVEEKIKDFPDKEEYYEKVRDMKQLTKIYIKHQNKEELTKEELKFLYEIDSKIVGFGYYGDPRIEEIIQERVNLKQDIALILDCKVSQIAITKNEITDETKYYKGDLFFNESTIPESFIFPEILDGGLSLNKLTSAEGLVLPKSISKNLYLAGLTSAKGLKLPKRIGGSLDLSNLISSQGLVLPKTIERNLDLRRLMSAEGLVFPQTIGGSLLLRGLVGAEGLVLPQTIGENLFLSNLTSAEGLVLPKNIGGKLYLFRLTSAQGLIIPDPLTYSIYMDGFKITPENVHEYRNNNKKPI